MISIVKFGDGLDARWDGDVFVSYGLFLTDKGSIVLMTLRSEKVKGSDVLGTNRARVVEFEEVNDSKLALLISDSHGRITDLVESLQEVLVQGIMRREQQLVSLREILMTVTRFHNLIDLRLICKECGGGKKRSEGCPNCGNGSGW